MVDEVVCQNRCSFLKLLLLAILINEGELHGYALYKRILNITQMRWKPSIGTIYRLLNEMTERELILKSVKKRKHGYTITSKGLEYFAENSKIPITRVTGMLATILEAYFKITKEKPEMIAEDINERLKALKEVLEKHSKLIE